MNFPIRNTDDGCLVSLCLSDKQKPSLVVGYDSDYCCSFVELKDIIFLLNHYGYKVSKETDVVIPMFDEVRKFAMSKR